MKNIYNIIATLLLLSVPSTFQAQNDNEINANQEIAFDSLRIGDDGTNLNQNSIIPLVTQNDKIVSNVTTNSGKDFFNFFNQINLLSDTIYTSDVTISEKHRDNSRHTEISIHSDSRLIYKFRTIAKKDYLFAAAQETIKRLKLFYTDTHGVSFVD